MLCADVTKVYRLTINFIMSDLENIKVLADVHPKPSDIRFQYGTAGFRTL